jgi:RNA polymerase sigma-70 factor (ECF subfamily)
MPPILNHRANTDDYNKKAGSFSSADDPRLIQMIAQGDRAAFTELYHRHSSNLYNFLLRLIHEQAIAEELLQEVFLAVWTGASTFRKRSSVKTWIFRIGHNKAISWLRRYKRVILEKLPDLPAEDDHIDDEMMLSWQSDKVTEALDSLSPKHRAVIELSFVHNLSYADIAAIVECPVGTVKSRMSYALRHLHILLKSQGFE